MIHLLTILAWSINYLITAQFAGRCLCVRAQIHKTMSPIKVASNSAFVPQVLKQKLAGGKATGGHKPVKTSR